MELKYKYTFPLLKGKEPKYNVVQEPTETFNWHPVGKKSVYLTDTRHPELEKHKDVDFEEIGKSVKGKRKSKSRAKGKSKGKKKGEDKGSVDDFIRDIDKELDDDNGSD